MTKDEMNNRGDAFFARSARIPPVPEIVKSIITRKWSKCNKFGVKVKIRTSLRYLIMICTSTRIQLLSEKEIK